MAQRVGPGTYTCTVARGRLPETKIIHHDLLHPFAVLMNNFPGNYYPWLPRGPRPYHEGKDVGGVASGSRVSFWTWPALVAACARGRLTAFVCLAAVPFQAIERT